MDLIRQIWTESGIYQISGGQIAMIVVCLLLLYLGIVKKFEPLLLVTIGFGGLLSNIPGAGIAEPGGLLYLAYEVGIKSGAFPLIIFMGVGALTDFGPLLANPKTLFLGAAAQFGIFATLIGALGLTELGIMDFTLREAAAIGIIGGADGPTAIYVAGQLAPNLLGAIAIADSDMPVLENMATWLVYLAGPLLGLFLLGLLMPTVRQRAALAGVAAGLIVVAALIVLNEDKGPNGEPGLPFHKLWIGPISLVTTVLAATAGSKVQRKAPR